MRRPGQWNSDNFCRAIQRAVDLNCEVVHIYGGQAYFQALDLSNPKAAEKRLHSEAFKKKIAASTFASTYLKECFI